MTKPDPIIDHKAIVEGWSKIIEDSDVYGPDWQYLVAKHTTPYSSSTDAEETARFPGGATQWVDEFGTLWDYLPDIKYGYNWLASSTSEPAAQWHKTLHEDGFYIMRPPL